MLLILGLNGCILFYVLVLAMHYLGVSTYYALMLSGFLSLFALVGLVFLFKSTFGRYFLCKISGARRATWREQRLLDPVITYVQATIQTQHFLKPITGRFIDLMVIEDPMPNAFILDKHTLLLSRGLYETTTEKELAGILAHTFAHYHHGNSQRLVIVLGISILMMPVLFIVNLFFITYSVSLLGHGIKIGALLTLFLLLFVSFSGLFLLFIKKGNGILRLAMLFQNRQQNYQADRFTVEAGLGNGLLSFLNKHKSLAKGHKSVFARRLYRTHSQLHRRVSRLEKALKSFTAN